MRLMITDEFLAKQSELLAKTSPISFWQRWTGVTSAVNRIGKHLLWRLCKSARSFRVPSPFRRAMVIGGATCLFVTAVGWLINTRPGPVYEFKNVGHTAYRLNKRTGALALVTPVGILPLSEQSSEDSVKTKPDKQLDSMTYGFDGIYDDVVSIQTKWRDGTCYFKVTFSPPVEDKPFGEKTRNFLKDLAQMGYESRGSIVFRDRDGFRITEVPLPSLQSFGSMQVKERERTGDSYTYSEDAIKALAADKDPAGTTNQPVKGKADASTIDASVADAIAEDFGKKPLGGKAETGMKTVTVPAKYVAEGSKKLSADLYDQIHGWELNGASFNH